MKKVIAYITILLIIFNISCFATINISDYEPSTATPSKIQSIGNNVIGVFQVIGSICSVIILLIIGIRFMLASPSERANLKASLVPYLVGAVMLFSIVNLLQLIYNIVNV